MKEDTQDMLDEYIQTEIIHCPINECKGMLLINPFKYELKCSDCNRYFLMKIEYREVKL